MTYETRRLQMREALIEKARKMQEADHRRRLETLRTIDKARRDLRTPYTPEAGVALFRDLFGDGPREAVNGK